MREDGAYLYPIIDGIPVMLIGEAIALSDFGGASEGKGGAKTD